MKNEQQIRDELEYTLGQLKIWRDRYRALDSSRPDAGLQRMTLGNTICGVEGQIEALKWVLEED